MCLKHYIAGFILTMFLFSCDPCRNGKACHRNGDKVKKKQIKKSKSKQRNQGSGGFSM